MSMMFKRHPGEQRIAESPHAALIWRMAGSTGVHFRWDGDCYLTYGLTRDAWQNDERRWESDTALSSLCRAVREHPKLAGEPVLRYLLFYVAVDYCAPLLERRFK